jgi:NCS1 family nucleobase:cation symporter-1
MPDRPLEFEKAGVEQIPAEARHGSPGRVFTLWLAANLTVADYVIGVLSVQAFGLTVGQALPVLLVGNVLGGVVLGLSASMGPELGLPQMMSSRSSFGRRGNYLFGGLNWVSTVGWFTVNTILGVEALQTLAPALNYFAAAALLVAVQVLVAVYGHDFIHAFEKWMSVALGALFLGIFALEAQKLGGALSFVPPGGSAASAPLGALGVVLAVSFSYLMSWSPYASDYSRYLPRSTSKRRVAIYALAGGGAASFAVEAIGALVGALTPAGGYFHELYRFSGWFGPLAMLGIVLGVLAANALNIYTNSLSALVLDVRAKRWVTVLAGGAAGLALSWIGRENFVDNFQNFLLVLDYWIMPWFGIILVDFFVAKRTTVESVLTPRATDWGAVAVYAASVLVSVPFMVPALSLPPPFGSLAYVFGGGDFSYFVSFGAAVLLALALRSTGRRLSGAPAPPPSLPAP